MQSFASRNGFSFDTRSTLMPGAGEAVVFELRRSDFRILGRNIAERQPQDSEANGGFGPVVLYSPTEFRVSFFPGDVPIEDAARDELIDEFVRTVGSVTHVEGHDDVEGR